MRKWIALAIVGILFSVFSISLGQDVPQQSWTAPKFLGDGWWQSLTLDQQNNLHVTWYGGYESPDKRADKFHDILKYDTRSSDGTWGTVADVIYTGDGGYTVRNSITVTTDGMLHVAYRGNVNHYVSSAPVIGATNGANWTAPNKVLDDSYYVSMIADSNDILHLVTSGTSNVETLKPTGQTDEIYAEGAKCFRCYDLFYRRSTDEGKTWSDIVPISIASMTGSDRPEIQQGKSGRLYITWDEGLDWYHGGGAAQDVRMVYSDDDGLTWSPPIVLDGAGRGEARPIEFALTELADGSLMAVWRYSTNDDRNIYYQLSSDVGKTWTEPVAIPGIVARNINRSSLDQYDLLTDRLGIVHLFAVGSENKDSQLNEQLLDVRYVPTSNYWVQPQRIYYSSDARPEWPNAVIGPANDIHLTWFNRGIAPGSDCNTCDLKVYYSYLPGNMVAEPTRAFRPTLTPLPTATVFVNIEPTTTPFPTLEGVSPITVTTADNYAAQTFLGGMLISALFCGAVILVVRLRR